MTLTDRRMDRLEEEGVLMAELEHMSDAKLRIRLDQLLSQAEALRVQLPTLSFTVMAEKIADCRGEMGILMRECEIRSQN